VTDAPASRDSGSLRSLLTARYETSVVRRTVLLLALVMPAFCANFLVLYLCADLLSPAEFGIFYAASAIGNILYSGSLVLNLYFTRYLAHVRGTHGPAGVPSGLVRIQAFVAGWGAAIGSVLIVLGVLVGSRVGVGSLIIVVLIVLDAYTAYVGDLGRVFLQASRRTALLGTYTLVWMVLRLVFCLIGVLLFRTVWSALSGVVFSALIMIAGTNAWLLRTCRGGAAVQVLPSITAELPAILCYGMLVAVANLDILLGYFVLPDASFGAYAASSILPKAILAVIMPLQQMLFPMMTGGTSARADAIVGLKGAAVVAGIAVAGVATTRLGSPILCGAPPGLLACQPPLMAVMLWSVVPLALIRVLMLGDFARRRYFRVVWLVLPSLAYAWWAAQKPAGIGLAWGFVGCCTAGLVLLAATGLSLGRLRILWRQDASRSVSNAGGSRG
jgi:O-antigen/teichoic acid export membrane protein